MIRLLAILLLMQPPTESELTAARARAAAAFDAAQKQSQVDELFRDAQEVPAQGEVVEPPVKQVQVDWQVPPVSSVPVTMKQTKTYIVTQDNCPPCESRKQELARQGIAFEEVDWRDAQARFGIVVRSTPYVFTREEEVVTQQTTTPPAVAVVESDLDKVSLQVFADHLSNQSGQPQAMKGMFDVDVDAPPFLPDLLNQLLVNRKYTNSELGITAEWPAGATNLRVQNGEITITPPIKVTKQAGIFSVRASLDSVKISEQGHRIDLSLSGSPDLTILLKGTNYSAAVPATPAVIEVKAPAVRSRLPVIESKWGPLDLENYDRQYPSGCNCPMCQYARGMKAQLQSSAQQPTPDLVLQDMVSMLQLTSEDVFADIGCGDGRVLIAAVERYGCSAIGIEIDPAKAEEARRNVASKGLQDRIRIITGDAKDFVPEDYGVTAASAYLYPELLSSLRPMLDRIPVVMSPFHQIPGMEMERRGDVWVKSSVVLARSL